MKNSPLLAKPVWWLLLSIVASGSMAYYVSQIWSANQPAHFNDLYAPWWGAHELLLHARNPYSPQVAHEIQTVIYGAPAAADSQDPSGIGGGFAYPPYIALLLWPTVYLSFSAAQKVFLSLSILGTFLSIVVWFRLTRSRQPPLILVAATVFTLGSFPVLQGIKLQNPSLLAAFFIAITFFLLFADHLVLAGAMLALSTFKPQFMIVLIPWLALWTLGDWRRRRPLAMSFLASMFLLVAVSEWLLPNWIPSFLRVVGAYRHYTYGHSLLDVWFTPTWGPIVAALVLLAALALCWKHRQQPSDSRDFTVVTSLALAATLIIIPTLAPHAQVLLLPGILCLLQNRTLPSSAGPLRRMVLAGTWTLLAWPWIAAFALVLAAMKFPAHSLLRFWELPLYTSPVLPVALVLGLSCLLFPRSSGNNRRFEASRRQL
ncbi:MAG: glycosyltransferase family 87 protein [Candidatus Sulfotelmatobacter sp.]